MTTIGFIFIIVLISLAETTQSIQTNNPTMNNKKIEIPNYLSHTETKLPQLPGKVYPYKHELQQGNYQRIRQPIIVKVFEDENSIRYRIDGNDVNLPNVIHNQRDADRKFHLIPKYYNNNLYQPNIQFKESLPTMTFHRNRIGNNKHFSEHTSNINNNNNINNYYTKQILPINNDNLKQYGRPLPYPPSVFGDSMKTSSTVTTSSSFDSTENTKFNLKIDNQYQQNNNKIPSSLILLGTDQPDIGTIHLGLDQVTTSSKIKFPDDSNNNINNLISNNNNNNINNINNNKNNFVVKRFQPKTVAEYLRDK